MAKKLAYILLLLTINWAYGQYYYEFERRFFKDSAVFAKALYMNSKGNVFIAGTAGNSGRYTWIKILKFDGKHFRTLYVKRYPVVSPADIVADSSNNFTILGYNLMPNFEKNFIWLARFSAQGRLLWERSFYNFGDSYGVRLQQTQDKGYVIAANAILDPSTGYDWLLLKTDSLGLLQWYKTIGSLSDDKVNDIAVNNQGIIAAVGYTKYNNGGNKQVTVSLYAADGSELYYRNFKLGTWSEATSVTATKDSGFAITGFFKDRYGVLNSFVLKINARADSLWFSRLQMPLPNIPFSIIQAYDSSLVVAFNLETKEYPLSDIGVAQFTPRGKLKFLRLLRKSSDDFVARLVETNDNGLYLLATLYLIQRGWLVSLIKCQTTRKSQLFFLFPNKRFSVFYKRTIEFKLCISGYMTPKKIEIFRGDSLILSSDQFAVTGKKQCPFYTEVQIPLKYGMNNITVKMTDYKGNIIQKKRKILYIPVPERFW